MPIAPRDLYNRTSEGWRRDAPACVSDYTARTFLLDWCEPLADARVLDIGCGEGYFARRMHARGAGHIEAIDVSEAMIHAARSREEAEPQGIRYAVLDAVHLEHVAGTFDLITAVFSLNYLALAQLAVVMQKIGDLLRDQGRLAFVVPHPFFPYLSSTRDSPLYFDRGEAGYFSGRGRPFAGQMAKRQGGSVSVQCVHRTVEDYIQGLGRAGLVGRLEIRELGVTEELMRLDPSFFGPLRDLPLHLAFKSTKG
jgi:SAM-dependent methyltransferase